MKKSLMDIKVISTMGLTKDDLHAIEGLSDVAKAEGGFSQDMLLNIDDNQKVLHVMSIPESMNELTVSEGRMPEKEGECLVDIDFLEGTLIGLVIRLRCGRKFRDIGGQRV